MSTSSSSIPPPASQSFLNNLPLILITIDDITAHEDDDHPASECLICLDSLEISSIGCKLDCGHIFHQQCIKDWLSKQSTCPECRYEYPTNDRNYEIQRKKKMKLRKIRLRRDELKLKTSKELKEINEMYELNTQFCIEKNELIEQLIRHGCIDLQQKAPIVEIKWKDLKSKSIFALKQMMMAFGISTTNVIEKDDMITSICESGRIQLLFDETDDVSSIPTSITGVNTTLYSYSSSALLGGDDFDYLPSSKASTPSPTKTSSHTSFGSTPTPPPARSPATNTTSSSSYSYTSTTSTSSSSSSSRQQSNSHSRSHTRGESRTNSECTTH